ncbi:glycosyltransferase family 4 protein [Treponema brennaborense]|uniref:Glycosyl transferase group 1 n=1 Tax=Treponema brennaborense (strain DSM 12168 / CIP 105900 / DD5/3) TaxID=906968 RepID=F4LMH5_TREBD|nr:glycosyltransferase family 4 protein [Treponema brennaborense]AEE15737.1 glycosyl transferase group 1 [Treponema brennaborense DSM 12168]
MIITLYIANIIYKFGGTESYTANLIEALQKIDPYFRISVITEHHAGTKKLSSFQFAHMLNDVYGVDVNADYIRIEYVKSKEKRGRFDSFVFQRKLNFLTKQSDIFFYCSKGLMTGKAKHNVAVIHFPMERKTSFPTYKKIPFLKPLAVHTDKKFAASYDFFLPNSEFTSYWFKEKWSVDDKKIRILYPPVTMISGKKKKEKNKILICSRIEQSKKIEELIAAYLSSEYLKEHCVLTVAGSAKKESAEYVESLKKIDSGIRFILDPLRTEIEDLYAESFIFWHAKGFGESDPYKMEHFGITTVEAMSAGCIPVVINKGGQPEIVSAQCGFKWDTLQELVKYTESIYKNPDMADSFVRNSIKQSKRFSKETFMAELKNLLNEQGTLCV